MSRLQVFSMVPAIVVSATFSIGAMAVEDGDKLLIEIGSISTHADTLIRVDGESGDRGTSVDFEDDLGLDKGKQINRLNARYRFTDKHSLKYSFFQLDRSTSRVIDKAIMAGDSTFEIDANLSAGFDYSVHSLSYGYSLRSDEDSSLDILAGLYYIETGIFLAEASAGKVESVDAAGPLPLIGFNYERELADQWNLGASATIFSLDIDDYDGSILDTRIRVDYQFTDRFGLGLAYNWQRFDAGVQGDSARAEFDMTVSGAELTVVLRF